MAIAGLEGPWNATEYLAFVYKAGKLLALQNTLRVV